MGTGLPWIGLFGNIFEGGTMARKDPKRPGRGSDQFVLRMPDGLRTKIARLAKANGRSMNSELIDRIEKSLTDTTILKHLEEQVELLWDAVAELQQSR
jgi:Arc-like DNA binding domain